MMFHGLNPVSVSINVTFSAVSIVAACTMLFAAASVAQPTWEPVPGKIMTRWASDVAPDNPLPEYPRPQMVRSQWQNLNGVWDYAMGPRGNQSPSDYQGGSILVLFPIEKVLAALNHFVPTDS